MRSAENIFFDLLSNSRFARFPEAATPTKFFSNAMPIIISSDALRALKKDTEILSSANYSSRLMQQSWSWHWLRRESKGYSNWNELELVGGEDLLGSKNRDFVSTTLSLCMFVSSPQRLMFCRSLIILCFRFWWSLSVLVGLLRNVAFDEAECCYCSVVFLTSELVLHGPQQ